MSTFKTVLLTIVCMVLLGLVSCRTWLEEVVPIKINERAVEYSEVDPDSFGAIESLADAKRVRIEIIVNHRDKQLALKRWSEDDNLAHADAYGFINADITAGEGTLDLAIGTTGNPLSIMGLIALISGGSCLAIGKKYFKRPGDFTPQEHEVEVTKAKNGNA